MVFVYEYSGTTWVQVAVLQGLPADTPQAFGHSVALEGGRLVVGAPTASSSIKDAGRIYVYENTSGLWTLTEVITDRLRTRSGQPAASSRPTSPP